MSLPEQAAGDLPSGLSRPLKKLRKYYWQSTISSAMMFLSYIAADLVSYKREHEKAAGDGSNPL